MAFEERTLQVTFKIGEGSFGNSGFDTLTVQGLRCSARVTNAGGSMLPSLDLVIYGMTLSQMNQLSTLGQVITTIRRNYVVVLAGSTGKPLTKVFEGTILNAWIDPADAPNVAFHVTAKTMALEAVKPIDPSSYAQEVAAEDVLAQLAQKIGWQFENNGVHVMLPISYWPRTPREQILAVIQAAGIEWNCGEGNLLSIWPKGGNRNGTVPIISPSTGMQGYPMFTQNGVKVSTLFNPSVVFGGQIIIKDSQFTQANATWNVFRVNQDLAAYTPGGPWFTEIDCVVPGYTKVA